jgi:hypothetical protein
VPLRLPLAAQRPKEFVAADDAAGSASGTGTASLSGTAGVPVAHTTHKADSTGTAVALPVADARFPTVAVTGTGSGTLPVPVLCHCQWQ